MKKHSILTEAAAIVAGPRQNDYDHPIRNYTRLAQVMSAILDHPVSAEQAALCMVGVKLVRESYRPKRDNRVDMAGYAYVLDLIAQARGEYEHQVGCATGSPREPERAGGGG